MSTMNDKPTQNPSFEHTETIFAELWPFLEDIALTIESPVASEFIIVLESVLYEPIARERLRRIGYEATASSRFIKGGHPHAHAVVIEVRSEK